MTDPRSITPRITARRVLVPGKKYHFEQIDLDKGGVPYRREMVNHPGAVVIVPVLPDGRVVMIRNYRVTVEEWLIECCAGTIERLPDGSLEPPSACAPRELIEETGYRAGRMESLGWFYTTPGLTNEKMHAFLATDLTHVGQRLEADEMIEVVPMSPREIAAAIRDGSIRDGKSIGAITLASLRGLITLT